MSTVTPMLEITEAILEVGGETLNQCIQCGTCTGVCPWNLVDEFSPRQLLRLVCLGLEGYEQDALWNCVTCSNCVNRCPREIDIIDVIRSTRSTIIWMSSVPPMYRAPFSSLHNDGNPWSSPRAERMDWNKDVAVPKFEKNTEYFFFACCTNAYDNRNKKILKEIAQLLLKGSVSMGIIGTDESCCGDQAHKCGGLDVYTELEENNKDLFNSNGVKKIIATSPHCMNMFNKHYDENYVSYHYTQILDKLINEGKLVPKKEIPMKIAFHDPCYLGRHNGIYEEPRNVLKSIPGVEFTELPRNRENSLCCGGGGGGIWSEVDVDKRFGTLRIKEAKEAGVQVIATACPFCTIMLEDSLKAMGIEEEEMKILDVAEILYQSLNIE